MEFNVFVPPGPGPFPSLYFLSGLTCTPENVTTKAGAQRVAAELGIILVMPDTSPRGANIPGEDDGWDFGSGAGFYVDATRPPWNKHYKMYSYLTKELPELMAKHFPVNTSKSITGHSMGGHGALVIGLREPDQWASISALSPICAPIQCPWGQKAFAGYLGNDQSSWSTYDASELVKTTQHPAPILIDQGKADDFYVAKQLLPEIFEEACKTSKQELNCRLHDNYDHSYYFIATFMEDHLRHHAKYLSS